MTRNSRLQQWYDTATDYSKDDVKDLAGVLLMHKFLFGLGLVSAAAFRLPSLLSGQGWSAKEVVTSATSAPGQIALIAVVGFVALPWIIVWRYRVYPRVKRYPLGDFVSGIVIVGLGMLATAIAWEVVTTSAPEAAAEVQETTEGGLVTALQRWFRASIFVISGMTLTTLWERYLDGRLTLGTRRRQTIAVVGIAVLIIAPGLVGAVPTSMFTDASAESEGADYPEPLLTNESRYTNGTSGPYLDGLPTNTSAGEPAPILVADGKYVAPPPKEMEGYAVASASYNASAFDATHIRVTDRNGKTITAPSHYNLTVDAPGEVIGIGLYRIEATGELHTATIYGDHLTLEHVESVYFVADVVRPDGEVHRYVVKIVNPRHYEGDANLTAGDSSTSQPAASIVATTDGNTTNTVTVQVNRMPPENQYQAYGLWEGCAVERQFNTTGTYTVTVQEDTNVKLVRLGDYRVYGYHDFAPNQTDQCPPS